MPTNHENDTVPIVLIGAYDRHNFGDMLFPHIAAKLLTGRQLLYGGLKRRDLRGYGGHKVKCLFDLARQYEEKPVHIVHVGGELLTCSTWEAAVMLLPLEEALAISIQMENSVPKQVNWSVAYTGMDCHAPYMLPKSFFSQVASLTYNAIGGVSFPEQSIEIKNEAVDKLLQADKVTVRDRFTQRNLQSYGIPCKVVPDAAVMTAELFSAEICSRSNTGEPQFVSSTYSQGYIAVQFSNDFADDQTLSLIASQLDKLSAVTRFAIVLFRAGAAPWHDDLSNYYRLSEKMKSSSIYIFKSLNIWDICALIATSQAYCGSSLHGLIVSSSFARPRVCIRHLESQRIVTKHEAYINTWESPDLCMTANLNEIENSITRVLGSDTHRHQQKALELADKYRRHFALMAKIWSRL